MPTHNQHPPQVHGRQPLKDRQSRGELLAPPEPLSTVKPYLFPAETFDASGDVANATECNLPQPRKDEFSHQQAASAAHCNLPQPRKNDLSGPQADAADCNLTQPRKNDFSHPQADAAQCNPPQRRKNEFAGPQAADAAKCNLPQPAENNPPATLSAAVSEMLSGDAQRVLSQRQQNAIGLLLTGEEDGKVAAKGMARKQLPHLRTRSGAGKNRRPQRELRHASLFPRSPPVRRTLRSYSLASARSASIFRTALDEAREMVFGSAIDRLRGLAREHSTSSKFSSKPATPRPPSNCSA